MRILILFLSFFLLGQVFSQELSKEEKKALLEEIKLLKKNPEKLKYMKEADEVKDVIISEQNNEVVFLKKEIQKKDIKNTQLRDSISWLTKREMELSDCSMDESGTKYRIQIGLFNNLDLTSMMNEDRFVIHEYINNLHRYSIGNFESREEAELFKLEIRKLGIKDAFVSQYYEGERVAEEKLK
ncbi:MAG: SPOR domain-containing protein [Chitinophagales bacterium]|nr:SPOR domain-containing protein [Chitinophagales bacterium]